MKSKRTKLTDIPPKVKQAVYIRDKGLCIICGKQGIPNAHYIRRSQGGLGIEQNIVTLCQKCHHDYDNGQYRQMYGEIIRDYLQSIYKDWNADDLIYDKWKDFKIK